MSDTEITWADFVEMVKQLEESRVPGPYYILASPEVVEAWNRLERKRQKYLERYRRRGERMKKK